MTKPISLFGVTEHAVDEINSVNHIENKSRTINSKRTSFKAQNASYYVMKNKQRLKITVSINIEIIKSRHSRS